jgi:sulfite exporter TauE/SafE
MFSAALRILATTALGGAAGLLGGLFGVGGGAIAIPLLGLLYHLDQQTAQGTTLVMVVPNVLLGFWRYRQRVGVDLRIAGALAFSAMASTYPAARFATGLDPRGLRLAFAGFLVTLAAIIAYRTRQGVSRQPDREPLPWGWSVPLGIVGGIVSGLFGVGGALIVPPASKREPLSDAAGRPTAGGARLRLLTKGGSPLSDRDLHMWYDRRVAELRARGETSSGEADWEAARQQFPARVTRARVRAVRDQLAPVGWRKQGRRSPRIAK